MGTFLKHYSEEDLKQLTEIDLIKLLDNENKLYISIGSNLHDKGEKILKHIDLINNIIKEKKQNNNNINNNNNNINNNNSNNLIFNKQTYNKNFISSNNYFNKNMENNVLNSMDGLQLNDRSSNNKNQHHHIKQLSVEESSQILQSNIIDSKISSLDKKFNEFGVDSPITNRRRNSENGGDSNIQEDEELNDNEEHDYVNPDDIDDEVDSIDPFDDEPYDQGFNYKLHDEFHYYDDDT
ncbi:hypothetical protein ACTFIV_002769 [Dictyostelium citrinum]